MKKKKKRLNNADLAYMTSKMNQNGIGSWVARMGLDEQVVKMRAEGKSYKFISDTFEKTNPKPNGQKWNWENIRNFMKWREERVKMIAANDTSVADKIADATIDTTEGIKKINKLLNKWVDQADTQGSKWVSCPSCGSRHEVEMFDSDKAVRICESMRKTMLTAQTLSQNLPDVQQQSSATKAVAVKKMIDKLVKDGVLVVVDPEKLHSFGL